VTTPCTQQEMIKEIRDDIKDLLKFKNTALGMIIAITAISNLIGFFVTIIVTKFTK
jgi:hypothetical protein